MNQFFHSVTLDTDKCMGCIHCIKRCPTEAIRVRNKKAQIIAERCIDCGECIRLCPHHAKKAIYDSLDVLKNYEYNVALPAPALYGQFNNLEDVEIVLRAIIALGFDAVYEVAKAAEIVSEATRKYMARTDIERPVISSACPAVTRLIRVRFPGLIPNILPLNAPVEVAARLARMEAHKKTGLPLDKIGTVFISPCPAKVTASKMPLGTKESAISAVVAISDVYPKLLKHMTLDGVSTEETTAQAGKIGVGWASSSGEAAALLNDSYLAADGIENVIRVLEDLEDEKFEHLDFIELNACPAGCIGGVMTVENPYIARTKLKRLRKYLPVSLNHTIASENELNWDASIEYTPVLTLDEDFSVAMTKLQQLEAIAASLPGLDCGSCGAPTCYALAEDVVRGLSTTDDCVYKLKENVSSLVAGIRMLDGFIPTNMRHETDQNDI